MSRGFMVTAVLAWLPAAAAGVSQIGPDLSGSWRVSETEDSVTPSPVSSASDPSTPTPPAPPRLIALAITQTPTELRMSRTMRTGDRTVLYNFVYRLDGNETTNQMGLISITSRVSWNGPKLVVSNVYSAHDRSLGEGTDTYSTERLTLIVESIRKAPIGVVRSRTVLTKAP